MTNIKTINLVSILIETSLYSSSVSCYQPKSFKAVGMKYYETRSIKVMQIYQKYRTYKKN